MRGWRPFALGADEAQLLFEERPRVDRRRRDRVIDDADVDATNEQPFVDRSREPFDDGKRTARISLPEFAHHGKRQVARHRGRKADDHVADGCILGLVDFPARPVDLLQDAAGMLEQALPRFGRRRAPPVAQQQVLAQLHLEAADLAADRRLGDPEEPAGAAESAKVDDIDEILELLQVHASAPSDPTLPAIPC